MPILDWKKIRLIFLIIILIELLSYVGYFFTIINQLLFFIIAILFFLICLKKIEYGLLIIFAELFIGSKGYLFYFENDNFFISIRIACFLIFAILWLGKNVVNLSAFKLFFTSLKTSKYFYYYLVLFLSISWGVINGLLNYNGFNNIFFDANGWLFFFLLLPAYQLLHNKKTQTDFANLFLAALGWLVLKTFLLLFIFSHDANGFFSYFIYRWVRESGVGEITQITHGFYRIFIQSQIFLIFAFFLSLFKAINDLEISWTKNINRNFLFGLVFASSCLAVLLISFSRSFWLGLIGAIFAVFIFFISKNNYRQQILKIVILTLSIFSIGLFLLIFTVKFPYPKTNLDINAGYLLQQRATQFSDEAGAASRWQLLPPLLKKNLQNPILGHGFGSTVSYQTRDPRILENNPSGFYTTYSFEWGWLDIWLKLGLIGLLSYLALCCKIIYDYLKSGWQDGNWFYLSLGFSLLAVVGIHNFSPYLNHPLGISCLILLTIFLEKPVNRL